MYKNICLNYKDKEKISYFEQLDEFIKGPCSPLTFSPGHSATSLRLEIDCEVLRKEDPETFESCYWNTCEAESFWQIWPFYRKPSKEINTWLPDTFSIISLFMPRSIRDKCYYNLMKIVYNPKSENQYLDSSFIQERKGIKQSWYGNTKETLNIGKCGFDAVYDCAGIGGVVKKASPYKDFMDTLEFLGYTPGLTLQIVAYDCRNTFQINTHINRFIKAIKELHRITGKKVIISAHSYGNLQVNYALQKMSKSEKDDQIKLYIPVAPTFGASTITGPKGLVGGSTRLAFGPQGMNYWSYMTLLSETTSIFESFPSRLYETHQNDFWMQNITNQIYYEREKGLGNTTKGLSFWPDTWEQCSRNYMYHDNCTTGQFNQSDTEIMRIGTESYNINQLYDYVKNDTFLSKDITEKIFDNMESPDYKKVHGEYQNPDVNMVVMYSSKQRTEFGLVYFDNIKKWKGRELFKNPDLFFMVRGDKTVNVNSAILAPLKWALEYEKIGSKKSVKFVEICSLAKQKTSPYDDKFAADEKVPDKLKKHDFQPFRDHLKKALIKRSIKSSNESKSELKEGQTIQKNDYIGLQCDSLHLGYKNTGHINEHNFILNDPYFQYFFANSVIDLQSRDNSFKFQFENPNEVKEYVESCKLIL